MCKLDGTIWRYVYYFNDDIDIPVLACATKRQAKDQRLGETDIDTNYR